MSKKILVLTVLLSCGASLFCMNATQPVVQHKPELVDVVDALAAGVAGQQTVSQEQAVAIVLSAIQNNPELATAVAQMTEVSSDDARGLSNRKKRDLMMFLAGAATGATAVWGVPKVYNAAKTWWRNEASNDSDFTNIIDSEEDEDDVYVGEINKSSLLPQNRKDDDDSDSLVDIGQLFPSDDQNENEKDGDREENDTVNENTVTQPIKKEENPIFFVGNLQETANNPKQEVPVNEQKQENVFQIENQLNQGNNNTENPPQKVQKIEATNEISEHKTDEN